MRASVQNILLSEKKPSMLKNISYVFVMFISFFVNLKACTAIHSTFLTSFIMFSSAVVDSTRVCNCGYCFLGCDRGQRVSNRFQKVTLGLVR